MSQDIFEKSPDLRRLREEGFEVFIVDSHLVVGNIPYVNNHRELQWGSLVCPLELAGNITCKPPDHVMGFTGTQPCNQDGKVIAGIVNCECNEAISSSIVVTRKFSNKPPDGYPDYYTKVVRYVEILSSPARSIDDSVDPRNFRVLPDNCSDSPFEYPDTNTGRAHIDSLAQRFHGQKVGIIGTGGTGSYVLDLASKTPVALIRLFDDDEFRQHNAFRTPGAASLEQLAQRLKKVDYLTGIYSKMHRRIEAYAQKVDERNLPLLYDLDFVFICIDNGPAKRTIINRLRDRKLPFIDVGLGVQLVNGKLTGTARVTACTELCSDHIEKRVSFGADDDDLYATNIQIADLNMLNAALAVMRWKKLVGFYADLKREHECGYVIECNCLVNDDFAS